MRILNCLGLVLALGAGVANAQPADPARVILVGDSTIASRSGWGDAFCDLLLKQVECFNMAKGGRSSASYRREGSWDEVLTQIAENGGAGETWVIVSFGHNDQAPQSTGPTGIGAAFVPNMAQYVADIREAGAEPILLTPVTRRQFRGGVLQDGLSSWSSAIRRVGRETETPVLDLASESVLAVQLMGPVGSMDLATGEAPDFVKEASAGGTTIDAPKDERTPAPRLTDAEREALGNPVGTFDYTHIGPWGARLFAGMVASEVRRVTPDLAEYLAGEE